MPAPPGTKKISDPTRQDEAARDLSAEVEELQAEIVALRRENAELRPADSERKQAEEALRESEEKYRGLFTSMSEAFGLMNLIHNKDGRVIDYVFLDVNPAWEQMSGIKREDAVGRNAKNLFGVVEDYWLEMFDRVNRTGEPERLEEYGGGMGRHYSVIAWKAGEDRVAHTFTDITERKWAEEQIAIEKRRLETVLETIPVAVVIVEAPTGNVSYVNKRAVELYGFDSANLNLEENLARVKPKRLDGSPFPTNELPVNYALNGQSTRNQELILERPDGTSYTIFGSASPILDAHGKPIAAVVVFDDITDRKQAEEALRISEERFRLVTENMVEGLVLFDGEGNLIYQNPASLCIHGFPTDEQVRVAHDDLPVVWNAWDETGRPVPFEEWVVPRTMRGEHVRDLVLRIRRPDTWHEFWARYNGAPIYDDRGRLMLIFLTMHDITERKQAEEKLRESEERFRIALQNSPITVATFDKDLRYTWAYNTRHGFRADDVIGKRPDEIIPPEEAAGQMAIMRHVLETGISERREASGTTHGIPWIFDFTVEPLRNEAGELIGLNMAAIDITERKQAEGELRRAYERTSALLESISDSFIALDKDWRFTYINQRGLLYTDKSPADVIGRSIWEVFPETLGTPLEEYYRRAMAGTEPLTYVVSSVVATGKHFELRAYPSGDGLTVFGRDITERKQAEEALLQQADLINQAFGIIVVRDLDDRITFWNDSAEAKYGWTREEAVGRVIYDLLKTRFPLPLQEIREELLCKGRWQGELVHTQRNGSVIVVESRWGLHRDAQGTPVAILETNADITERKRAEEERENFIQTLKNERALLQSILEQLPEGVIIAESSSGELLLANQRMQEIWGHPIPASGSVLQDREHPGFHIDWRPYEIGEWPLARSLTTGEAILDEEIEILRSDGGQGWVRVSSAPVRDAEGTILYGMVIFADITERKQAEEALRRQAGDLARLNRELTSAHREANLYLDILTHDIRNTENVSNLYAELLIDSMDGEAAVHIEKLRRSISKSIEILGTVSKIRRIHQGPPDIRPVDLDAVIREEAGHYPDSSIRYESAPYLVQVDDLLPEIFANLIGNAVKHGGPDVAITVRTEDVGEFVRVTVADTGPGVPDDAKDAIFHRYEQKKRGVGEGLGLYLVQILVERYGGRVWVEDRVPGRPEQGAAFRFTLQKAA